MIAFMDGLSGFLTAFSEMGAFLPTLIGPAFITIVVLGAIACVRAQGEDKLETKRVAFVLAVIIGAAFFTSLQGAYHFDDSHSVESNMAVRSMSNIPQFWTDSRTSSFIPENRVYRPLVYTFYTVCWWLGAGDTTPFHVMKMIMQLFVCLAIFLIWRRLWSTPGWFPVNGLRVKLPFVSREYLIQPDTAAFFLAAAFAVHPATSECVVYISATTSLQCAMFYVWAFYAYLCFRDSGEKKHLAFALVLYFLSVASKEEGITLPAMVIITELFLYKGSLKSTTKDRVVAALKTAVPYIALGLLLALWIVKMRPTSGDESRGWVSSYHYFITQWRAYLWYMRLWFWPWDLNADVAALEYSKSIVDPLVIQAALGNLALLVFGWFQRKRFPAMLFGLLWFYVTISPASSVVVLAEAINEHRMYLAYVGFIGGTFSVLLFCAENFFEAETKMRRVGVAYAMILMGLIIGTQERNRVWLNAENLWTDTVAKNPTSGRAMNNLALVHMSRGDYAKAIELLESCEKHWSSYMYCSLNKGISYAGMANASERSGKSEDAKKSYDLADKSYVRAYSLNPRNVHVNFQLGKWFEETRKDFAKAAEFYANAVRLTGDRFPDADIHLATCYIELKRFTEARQALDRAISVEPKNEFALFQKAKLEFEQNDFPSALVGYKRLLEINPRHLQAWYNYGVVLMANRDYGGAKTAFEATVALDPKSEQGWYNLGFANEKLGKKDEALRAARTLASINPSSAVFQQRVKDLEKK